MKKLLALLLALALTAALAGCSMLKPKAAKPPEENSAPEQVQVQAQEPLQPESQAPAQEGEKTPEPAAPADETGDDGEPQPAAALGVYAASARLEGRADDGEQTLVYTIEYETLSLETGEPEKLAEAIAALNAERREYAEAARDETAAEANERYAEQEAERPEPPEGETAPPIALDFAAVAETRRFFVTRADTRVLSAVEVITRETAGAAAEGYLAVTIAAETGETLAAGQVFTDLDALSRAVCKRLAEKYPEDESLESLEEGLPALLKDNAACWSLGAEGAEFYFHTDSGRLLTACVSYAGNAELFEPYYAEPAEYRAEPIFTDEGFDADFDGDGQSEEFRIERVKSDDGGADRLLMYTGDGEDYESFRFEGTGQEYYYVVAGEKRYLYVNALNGEDWGWTEVYELTGGEAEYIGTAEDSARDASRCRIIPGRSLMTDPLRFAMGRNVDLLGGFAAIRIYRVGEDGMPAPLDPMFNSDGESTLTLAQDLEVQGVTGKKVTLRAQTKLMLLSTDGSWRVDVSDGQGIYSIYDTLSASGEYVNGLAVKDVFVELAPAQTETETAG